MAVSASLDAGIKHFNGKSLNNDSLTDDQVDQIMEDRAKAEKAASLREEDYQLAYAIDILKGLSALGPKK